jgi:uncharacterized protein with HEPN domain
MSEPDPLIERIEQVVEALERIPRRMAGFASHAEFDRSPEARDALDAVCMVLIAVGEALKKIDRKTDGRLLPRYPGIDWKGAMGVRDVIAHDYFDLDAEEIFDICRNDVPPLIETLRAMIEDLRRGPA